MVTGLAALEATGDEFRARAGTLTLFLISTGSMPGELLGMLEEALGGGVIGPLVDLVLAEGDELRAYKDLIDDEDDEADEDDFDLTDFDPDVKMKTTSKGEQMLFVGFTLDRWLGNCPAGPLKIDVGATGAIAGLVFGWSATVTHALAAQPLTLAELDAAVEMLSYETLEEHVVAMERMGQLEAQPGDDGQMRYAMTDWLRAGVAPLAAAARMERHYLETSSVPPDVLDVEAAFQLALPLLTVPADLSGACRLGVQIPGDEPLLAGATVEIVAGRVVSASPLLELEPETFATGSPLDWMDTLVDPAAGRLETGGDERLTHALIDGLHEALFGVQAG
jgi:hypothetical protein